MTAQVHPGVRRPEARRIALRRLGESDLRDMAAVHVAAFPNSALSCMGAEAVRRYYDWQLTAAQNESVAIGSYVGGELGGFCVGGIFRGKMSGYLRRNRWFLLCRLALRPWLVLRGDFRERLVAGLRIVKVLPYPEGATPLYQDSDPTSFGILSIAVHPRFQRLGLGRALMDEAERIARGRGFTRMNLSVRTSNAGAIRFYEDLAWTRRPSAGSIWNGEMTKWLNQ